MIITTSPTTTLSATSKILQALVALQVLLTLNVLSPHWNLPLTSALPITSKPIESTAENLAWQAWLMLPPEQKNQEKARKVTPKSIFTLPFRECPPGHQLFESRCIPTVNIDQTALLTQQLLGIVMGAANADNNYEFDYEDEEVIMFEPPQKLGGGAESSSYDDASQLPSQDEPLKFNIFQQKFPTDYEGESTSNEGDAIMSANHTDTMVPDRQFEDAVLGFLQRQANLTLSTNNTKNNSFVDLHSESTNISSNLEGNATPTPAASSNVDGFSISDIDAIALPAIAASPAANAAVIDADAGLEPHNGHKISLFKDDSAVQLVTTVLADRNYNGAATQSDISQLLKADALLPLFNVTQNTPNNATIHRSATTVSEGLSGSTPLLTAQMAEDAVTGTTLEDAEGTTMPTSLSELLKTADEVDEAESEKDERIRSVTMRYSAEEELELPVAPEEDFTTTVEPEGTTNFQLDDTTIIETYDAPAAMELLQLEAQHKQELAQRRERERERENHMVLKKSKVEPVELVADTKKTTTASNSASPIPPIPASTPLPSVTATDTQDDRFDYQHLDGAEDNQKGARVAGGGKYAGVGVASGSDGIGSGNNMMNMASTAATTSEINIEQELRIINELVKGKRQLPATMAKETPTDTATATATATTTTTTTTTSKSITTATTESSFTAEIEETKVNEAEIEARAKVTSTSASNNDEALPTTTTAAAATASHTMAAELDSAATTAAEVESGTMERTTMKTTEFAAEMWSNSVPITATKATTTTTTRSTQPISALVSQEVAEEAEAAIATETESEAEASSTSPSPSNSSSNSSSAISINSNRSNRNSKIFRISSLSTSSLSESANSAAEKPAAFPLPLTGDEEATAASQTSTTATVPEASSTSSTGGFGSFWWLPLGWRVDTTSVEEESNAHEQSLLMRLWSAFPGNQAKVKQ